MQSSSQRVGWPVTRRLLRPLELGRRTLTSRLAERFNVRPMCDREAAGDCFPVEA